MKGKIKNEHCSYFLQLIGKPLPQSDLQSAPAARRAPSQRRSRERVESLLTVASALIAEMGSDALRMSDVAQRAAVSIGSLYQYFPDKGALIRALAERHNAVGRACVAAELDAVQDEAGLAAAMERILDAYYAMFLAEPVMRDIWCGTQADKELQAMDAEEGRWHGARLAETVLRLRPQRDAVQLGHATFLMMALVCATVRLAIAVERQEGDALIAAFKPMMLREVAAL
jgi:AcrR family transcriptional regulator